MDRSPEITLAHQLKTYLIGNEFDKESQTNSVQGRLEKGSQIMADHERRITTVEGKVERQLNIDWTKVIIILIVGLFAAVGVRFT